MEGAIELFLYEVLLKYGVDFRHYAPASMKRNLLLGMSRMGCESLDQLQEKVLQDSSDFDELLQSLTVDVSEFFRDPPYFKAFRERVIPHLKTYPSPKIWVAGCSTGEEVYSLAILLHEEDLLERTAIYATDINPRSLEAAKVGIFALAEVEIATPNYLKAGGKRSLSEYYSATLSSAKFNSLLSKNITFADHSLVTDAVFAEVNFISCRNVLIYFNRKLQDRAYRLFHESLCPKGFLGLGAQETAQNSEHVNDFESFVRENRIYQKK